jgi:adenosine deaminase
MKKTLPSLIVTLALAGNASAAPSNEALTRRHFAALTDGAQPKLAELTLFLSMMPKGGDLHHHYSGSIYAEQYLAWVDKQHYCVDKTSFKIETRPEVIDAERAKALKERACLSAADLIANDSAYRDLLQRWSTKDFANHGAIQPPPDRLFFDTFAYFNAVSKDNINEGLQTLKQRAILENVGYIETSLLRAPSRANPAFDQQIQQSQQTGDNAALTFHLAALADALEQDASFRQDVGKYVAKVEAASAGIDDAQFTMRYQAFVTRLKAPSEVFSSMLSGFKAASQSPLIVGVNIVGAENQEVAMRDYALHMQMFKFLKTRYPSVKLSLHAGELALGMVPPEGLSFHIRDAVNVAGAGRIGHGIDLAYEADAPAIMKTMREHGIAVEINLTSNEFIAGVANAAHPVTLYRTYRVPFVISTDDAGVSRNNLSNEYVLFASRYRTDYPELKKLSYDSLRYAFLADADKKRLIRQLDARFAKFEAAIAELEHGRKRR